MIVLLMCQMRQVWLLDAQLGADGPFCFQRLYGVECIMTSVSSHRLLAASRLVAVIMRGVKRRCARPAYIRDRHVSTR
jgi:hypothetical protein